MPASTRQTTNYPEPGGDTAQRSAISTQSYVLSLHTPNKRYLPSDHGKQADDGNRALNRVSFSSAHGSSFTDCTLSLSQLGSAAVRTGVHLFENTAEYRIHYHCLIDAIICFRCVVIHFGATVWANHFVDRRHFLLLLLTTQMLRSIPNPLLVVGCHSQEVSRSFLLPLTTGKLFSNPPP